MSADDAGRVLGVGIATLDIVNVVAAYPPEDAEVRAAGQRIARGGNVANTLQVLAQLGRPCAWAGVLGTDAAAGRISAAFAADAIDHGHAVRVPGGATPTSYIALSRATGSRTIVHHRDLPELTAADFADVPLEGIAWAHFEGRNPAETARMLARVRDERPGLPISVEIEKPRAGIEALYQGADVLIFARAFVQAADGADAGDPRAFLLHMAALTDARLLLLPWGADGAYGLARGAAEPVFARACPPAVLRDSLGAGDVFNAAVIDGLLAMGLAMGLATGLAADADGLAGLLARANRLAGHKCGQDGLGGLVASARAAGLLPATGRPA
ncbi:PfkB family carbohydrate kinase [Thiohalocapsa sp. ML1]|uniref:PfkB family carbohydrate kinase n=1 Tax=Thiohalocapsa sp. ML1 TaxID=1431688 RepID=UPI0007322FA7|nr:PfkB family carbohydrate kinase [Thiohalocapsa sp. ML1]